MFSISQLASSDKVFLILQSQILKKEKKKKKSKKKKKEEEKTLVQIHYFTHNPQLMK